MKNTVNYSALEAHFQDIKSTRLLKLFEQDFSQEKYQEKQRGEKFSLHCSGLYFDYSKNHITEETITLFSKLANELNLKEKINSLYTGDVVNKSEHRAALHTALRDTNNSFGVNTGIHQSILAAREKTFDLARQFTTKQLKNRHGNVIQHLICLGIGGSYLGPKFVTDALQNPKKNQENFSMRFLATVDPHAVEETLTGLNLEECLFFIASKSFTTLESLSNANFIKQQLLDLGLSVNDLTLHFAAATENVEAALAFGCKEAYVLPLWNFIGGRFSLWSSIGFPIVVALGEKPFLELLKGAHQMDKHFIESEFDKNMPFILACLSLWYQNFFKAPSRAIICYDHKLKTFPAFLQQLEMESLGKSVDEHGKAIEQDSGAIIWGSEGPNSQHAFHQLLHQGTHLIPCDFLVCKQSSTNQHHQDMLFAECVAQSRTLMKGDTSTNTHQLVKGNKPSNTFILDKLSANSLGALIALYEHKVFAEAVLLGINPFDQWGVQLGKTIGKEIGSELKNHQENSFDSSTKALIQHYKQ